MEDEEFEDGSLSEAADHDPTRTWIGCPKCGLPINITVPVKDHAYEVLAHVHDMLAHTTVAETREAIDEVLMWLGMEINSENRRNGDFWPLIQASERAEARKRRQTPHKTNRRQGKRKTREG